MTILCLIMTYCRTTSTTATLSNELSSKSPWPQLKCSRNSLPRGYPRLETKNLSICAGSITNNSISQGFQLIVLPSTEAAGRTTRASSTEVNQTSAPNSSSNTGSLLRSKSRNNDNEAHEEHMLSIGRLFHKIALKGNSIHVTRYRPR